MNKMSIDQLQAKTKNRLVFQQINPEITKGAIQNNIQTPIKQSTLNTKVNPSYNQLSNNLLIVPPSQSEDGQNDLNEIEINLQPKAAIKRKKDWKSWSLNEKINFYEIIANGGNYSSLQKLFKIMNDKIGTKSTEKIRDYYYRMLKNVNTLLKSSGEMGFNSKNRDEVILAIGCYGKILNSSTKKSKFDMKKLNKHPRLFKKIAITLKNLITKQIKMVRSKKINNLSNSANKSTRSKIMAKNTTKNNKSLLRPGKTITTNINNEASDFSRIINVTAFRKIPYESFIIRLTPYDKETYLKMIEDNYCSRLEINVSFTKPIKHIIDVLSEKWKNIPKKYSKHILYLIPIEEIWIPNELTFFSTLDSGKAYDLGDIYTAYGSPSTNMLYMYYQWAEAKNEPKAKNAGANGNLLGNVLQGLDDNIELTSDKHRMNNGENQNSNCAIKNDYSYEEVLSEGDGAGEDEDGEEEDDQEKEKSFIALESDLNIFDPLEFLGFDDDKKNSNEEDDDNFNSNSPIANHFPNKNIFVSTKSPRHKNLCKTSLEIDRNQNNNNNLGISNQNNNNSKLRTGYSEMFSQSESGLLGGINQKSNQSTINNNNIFNKNITPRGTIKKKIPFSNNVNKNEVVGSENFMPTRSYTKYVNNTIKNKDKDNALDKEREESLKVPEKFITELESSSPESKSKSTPKKRIESILINKNSMIMHPSSNFGLTALFQPDQSTKMINNGLNISLNNNDYNNNAEINFINQNSANFNSIFEYGNNNTNMDFFRNNNNYNTSNSNIFKIDYPNINSNHYPYTNTNNLPNNIINNYHDHLSLIKDEHQDIPIKETKEELLNKKSKRTKEKKKPEKITIEEIEESEKKQHQKKQKNISSSQPASSCIINQNNYFTNYPGQYYAHAQMQRNIDIPIPSKFLEDKHKSKEK